MKKNKKILYIGNDNSARTGYVNTMETLSSLLTKEGYKITRSSTKVNKALRLLDMCGATIKHGRKSDYIFIDTFSSLNFYFAFTISQLARLFSIKYIPILHGGNLPSRIKRSKRMSNMIFKNSYKNISPSNYLKQAFEEQGYEVGHIPNVLEIDQYKFKKREDLKPRLLWVRAFKHLYNPLLAIEVINNLKKEFSEVKLCMVGPVIDDSFKKTQQKVKEYGMTDDVEYTGTLSKEVWVKRSEEFDIFINTTNFDNTPVSVMEAMALGLPVVSTNVGGMPFLIENNVDGMLVEKENAEEMTNAIKKLLKTDSTALVDKARSKAESFGWEQVKTKWFEILD
ncbi:glycosyltransferase family 4 protein [Pseudotenacibaculum haliotis]|uniref:Glycosyltransferase family 4 protein n=1 Tax=Pseudotenacibaculum haliotis TaxID=1862138 RepID=A0ABW5LWR3_9FLAO